MDTIYNSQAGQDQYIELITKNKKNGFFLEIGTNHPVNINNTFNLEKMNKWRGLMVEYDPMWADYYKAVRPDSIFEINDARNIDYKTILEKNSYPTNMDYLQIDLEVENGSTIQTLEHLNNTILSKYKFASVTFEHDIWKGDHHNTRVRSREIFESRGYVLLFPDLTNQGYVFEDWYVHPDLVDMNWLSNVKQSRGAEWKAVIQLLRTTQPKN